MLRMHRAIVVLVPIVMLIPDAVVAENQERYLLNCRLIDRADERSTSVTVWGDRGSRGNCSAKIKSVS
jgi:hypothetical protein